MRKTWLVGVLSLALFTACTHYSVSGPAQYDVGGVAIVTQSLKLSGKKLELRFTFVNHTDREIIVDRDQMLLRMPSGAVMPRFKGTFGGMTPATHRIAPGLSHSVFMDFLVGDERGDMALQVAGVISDGRALALPEYAMRIEEE